MTDQFNAEWAKNVINENAEKAKAFMDDPEQINGLLDELQVKLQGLTGTVATAFQNVPLMAQMVKCYITGEYTAVSSKVIISLVATFLYLVKKNDLISDDIPIVGMADDVAVATIAMAINEPELAAFAEWRNRTNGQPSGTPVDAEAEIIEANVIDAD